MFYGEIFQQNLTQKEQAYLWKLFFLLHLVDCEISFRDLGVPAAPIVAAVGLSAPAQALSGFGRPLLSLTPPPAQHFLTPKNLFHNLFSNTPLRFLDVADVRYEML